MPFEFRLKCLTGRMIFLIGMIRTLLGEYTCSEVENSDEDEVQNTKRFKKTGQKDTIVTLVIVVFHLT